MRGILVVGHGSRSKEAYDTFYKIIEDLHKKLDVELEGCFMEISSPQIPEKIDNLVQKGVDHITVLPYFLFEGIHIKEDIPEILKGIKEKYDSLTIDMAQPIGYHPLLVDLLAERVEGEKKCI